MDENDLESVDAVIDNVQGIRDENINISDVIEVIETDLDFKQSPKMFNGGGEIPQPQPPMSIQEIRKRAYVRIVEEPASKALRFRYECEGRSAGSIPGASSTPENKTFPSIQIVGYTGRAVVVVSCVTKDPPYRPHPHNLVGREGCKKGVCTLEISPETMSVTFSNLGIQCIKKKDIEAALKVREEIRVDPFRTGFSHRNQPTSIDLNAVRLCFQVFLESERGKFTVPLTPVVSQPIYDKKAMSDLVIVKLSDCVSYVDGGRKDMILLCEKVAKEDIQIRFFEKKDGQIVWEGFGDFQPSQVHKQTAIWFRTPKYRTLDVTEPVKVFIQLRRPSDGVESEPLPFELLPLDSEPGMLKRKRKKFEDPNEIMRHLQEHDKSRSPYLFNAIQMEIKTEPRDNSPSPYGGQMFGGGISPMYVANPGVSPQYQCNSPGENIVYNLPYNSPQSASNIPSIDNMLLPNWHIPSTPNIQSVSPNLQSVQTTNIAADIPSANVSLENASALGSLFDLDTHQLKQINLTSGELANLTNNLSDNLSLSETGRQDHNMSDSLTRLANNVLDNMCGGSVYNPNQ